MLKRKSDSGQRKVKNVKRQMTWSWDSSMLNAQCQGKHVVWAQCQLFNLFDDEKKAHESGGMRVQG